ncbi:MAG: hypothetical protein GY932_00765 [Arcobacter sp.]|nr:hypothetical protein [Arcobacter sp.]
MRYYKLLIPLFIIILFNGCFGLSNRDIDSAKASQIFLAQAKNKLSEQRSKYQNLTKSDDFKILENYSKKENWIINFKKSSKELEHADKISAEISKIIEQNDSDDKNKLKRKISDLKSSIIKASKLYKVPFQRIDFLKNVIENSSKIKDFAQKNSNEVNSIYLNLESNIDNAKKEYPKKSLDLNFRLSQVEKINNETQNYLSVLLKEYNKEPDLIDYALYGDTANEIISNLKKTKDMDKSLRKRTSELYASYSKILKDMGINYYVVVKRASWNNSNDWDNTPDYTYPKSLVTKELIQYFETSATGTIAKYSTGGFFSNGFNLYIDRNMWNSLKISPTSKWPSNYDDEAEYWVEKTIYKYYHKYIVIENNKSTTTDWIEVNENTYYQQEANLGMEILSKPYGYYEEESITNASPIGMSTVGNPKYGEWKNDSNGNSFWHYYGMYSFFGNLMGPNHYYSRYDYDHYNNRRYDQPYYGRNNQYGTWGSKTYSNKNNASSHYAKTNKETVRSAKNSTGKKTSSRSVRNSASKTRGRGPGGGGK